MYKAYFKTKAFVIYKEDLFQLEEVMKSSVPPSDRKEDFEINVSFEKRSFKRYSVESLFKEQLSNNTDGFDIKIIGWNKDREIVNSIYISLGEWTGTVVITGENEIWVNGIKEILSNFFKERQRWYANIIGYLPYITGGVLSISLLISLGFFKVGNNLLGIVCILLGLIVMFLTYPKFLQRFMPEIQINYYEKEKKKVESVVVVATVVGSFFTILGTLIALITFLYR